MSIGISSMENLCLDFRLSDTTSPYLKIVIKHEKLVIKHEKLIWLTVKMIMSTETIGPKVDKFDGWRVLMGNFYVFKNIYVV